LVSVLSGLAMSELAATVAGAAAFTATTGSAGRADGVAGEVAATRGLPSGVTGSSARALKLSPSRTAPTASAAPTAKRTEPVESEADMFLSLRDPSNTNESWEQRRVQSRERANSQAIVLDAGHARPDVAKVLYLQDFCALSDTASGKA
jgi:hypothetical protein